MKQAEPIAWHSADPGYTTQEAVESWLSWIVSGTVSGWISFQEPK